MAESTPRISATSKHELRHNHWDGVRLAPPRLAYPLSPKIAIPGFVSGGILETWSRFGTLDLALELVDGIAAAESYPVDQREIINHDAVWK